MIEAIPSELRAILEQTPVLKRACIVGGAVRDYLLHSWGRLDRGPKDIDVEVYQVTVDDLIAGLSKWGKVDIVGKSFGVIKLFTESGQDYDFSVPRRESKTGQGHKGFKIEVDPTITPEEAAARRDFTFNALAFDYAKNQFLDFFGGVDDLKAGILRHTSKAFAEDILRVLRGMQFCGRFNLKADPATAKLCAAMKPQKLIAEPGRGGEHFKPEEEGLPAERVREEWIKWAKFSQKPSAGLQFLVDSEWIDFFPEIKSLIGCPQEPEWHPEGDVFTHTCHCVDALVTLPEWKASDDTGRATYSLAMLSHDFAKPQCTATIIKDGRPRITSHGHEEAGGPIAKSFLEKMNMPTEIIQRVVPLVVDHLAHITTKTDKAIRRLARRLHPETVDGLWMIMAADHMGRPPLPQVPPQGAHDLRDKARNLGVHEKPPEPFLMGRDLIQMGIKPGPQMGAILAHAYEAQLDGAFHDKASAIQWFKDGAPPAIAEAFLTALA